MAVNIGAPIGALARAGEVLVSSTVRELVVGSGLEFADRGTDEQQGFFALATIMITGFAALVAAMIF